MGGGRRVDAPLADIIVDRLQQVELTSGRVEMLLRTLMDFQWANRCHHVFADHHTDILVPQEHENVALKVSRQDGHHHRSIDDHHVEVLQIVHEPVEHIVVQALESASTPLDLHRYPIPPQLLSIPVTRRVLFC